MSAGKPLWFRIRRATGELLRPPILQYSPQRTGSTMVWNALCEMFPQRTVIKAHRLSRRRWIAMSRAPVVCTVRHPFDTIASSLQRYDDPHTPEVLARHWTMLERPFREVIALRDRPSVLLLRYEEFARSVDFLIDALGDFFHTRVDADLRTRIAERCDLERALAIAQSLGDDFRDADKETLIHARHISPHRGGVGYYHQVLTSDDLDWLRPRCRPILEQLGYEE